jgi:hypothetical protein
VLNASVSRCQGSGFGMSSIPGLQLGADPPPPDVMTPVVPMSHRESGPQHETSALNLVTEPAPSNRSNLSLTSEAANCVPAHFHFVPITRDNCVCGRFDKVDNGGDMPNHHTRECRVRAGHVEEKENSGRHDTALGGSRPPLVKPTPVGWSEEAWKVHLSSSLERQYANFLQPSGDMLFDASHREWIAAWKNKHAPRLVKAPETIERSAFYGLLDDAQVDEPITPAMPSGSVSPATSTKSTPEKRPRELLSDEKKRQRDREFRRAKVEKHGSQNFARVVETAERRARQHPEKSPEPSSNVQVVPANPISQPAQQVVVVAEVRRLPVKYVTQLEKPGGDTVDNYENRMLDVMFEEYEFPNINTIGAGWLVSHGHFDMGRVWLPPTIVDALCEFWAHRERTPAEFAVCVRRCTELCKLLALTAKESCEIKQYAPVVAMLQFERRDTEVKIVAWRDYWNFVDQPRWWLLTKEYYHKIFGWSKNHKTALAVTGFGVSTTFLCFNIGAFLTVRWLCRKW